MRGKIMKNIIKFVIALIICLLPMTIVYADNNAFNLNFGEQRENVIADAQKNITYKVELIQAGNLTIDVKSYMRYLSVSVTDANGDQIEGDNWISQNSSNEFGRWNPSLDLEPGTYYINLKQQSGYTGKVTIKTQYSKADVNEVESNNKMEQANTINMGSEVKGYMTRNDDMDMYKFEIGKQGKFTIDGKSYMRYLKYEVIDQEGNSYIYDNWISKADQEEFGRWSGTLYLEPGTYYVKIAKQSGYTGIYSFKPNFEVINSAEKEPNDKMSSSQNINVDSSEAVGALTAMDDIDVYKFEMPIDGNVNINLKTYMRYIKAEVIDSEGNSYGYDNWISKSDNDEFGTWKYSKALRAGTYYIKIAKQSGYTGKYSIKVTSPEIVNYNVDAAINNKTFARFQIAYAAILSYYDGDSENQTIYLGKIAPLYDEVNTQDVINIRKEIEKLAKDKDLGSYIKIENELILSVQNADNKAYILGELAAWGNDFVWTTNVKKAVADLNEFAKIKDTDSKNKVLNSISAIESEASRAYLKAQVEAIH
jgi:RNA binding exosome subunit